MRGWARVPRPPLPRVGRRERNGVRFSVHTASALRSPTRSPAGRRGVRVSKLSLATASHLHGVGTAVGSEFGGGRASFDPKPWICCVFLQTMP